MILTLLQLVITLAEICTLQPELGWKVNKVVILLINLMFNNCPLIIKLHLGCRGVVIKLSNYWQINYSNYWSEKFSSFSKYIGNSKVGHSNPGLNFNIFGAIFILINKMNYFILKPWFWNSDKMFVPNPFKSQPVSVKASRSLVEILPFKSGQA